MRHQRQAEKAREEAKEAKLREEYEATKEKLEEIESQMKCSPTVKRAFENLNAVRPIYREAQEHLAAAVDALALFV